MITSTHIRIWLLSAAMMLCGLHAVAQQARERLSDEETTAKETLKQLKKQYRAKSVTIERLEDGRKYYVLHGADESEGLVRDDLTPVQFKGWTYYRPPKGKTREEAGMADFIYGYTPQVVYHGGKPYYQVRSRKTYVPGLFDMDGKTVVPPCNYTEIWAEERLGKTYLFARTPAGSLGVYTPEGAYWGNSDKGDVRFYPAAEAGYSDPAASSIGMSVWHPRYDKDIICFGKTVTLGATALTPERKVHYELCAPLDHSKFKSRAKQYITILDGNYYVGTGPNGVTAVERNEVRDMGDGSTGMYRTLDMTQGHYHRNLLSLYDRNWRLIADSCTRIVVSAPDQMVYTYRYYGKPDFIYRKGAVSLTDSTVNIPPRFDDIIVRNKDDGRKIYVKDWAFGDYREYTPGDAGRLNFDEKWVNRFEKGYAERNFSLNPDLPSFLLSNSYVADMPKDSLCDYHRAMYLYGVVEQANSHLRRQQKILESYAAAADPLSVPGIKAYMSNVDSKGLTYTGGSELGAYRRKLGEWIQSASTPADSARYAEVLRSLDIICTDIAFNTDFAIPRAHNEFATAQALERQRLAEEAARQRAIREERDARIAAILGMFSNVMGNLTSSHSTHRSGASAKASGSGRRTSVSGGGGSDNHSGDKARLKREIAQWEEKIRKAEESYAQALENYNSNRSWEAKRVVDSKLKTINEFCAERDRCKAELASY